MADTGWLKAGAYSWDAYFSNTSNGIEIDGTFTTADSDNATIGAFSVWMTGLDGKVSEIKEGTFTDSNSEHILGSSGSLWPRSDQYGWGSEGATLEDLNSVDFDIIFFVEHVPAGGCYYAVNGFDFSSIPESSTINGIEIKVSGYRGTESGGYWPVYLDGMEIKVYYTAGTPTVGTKYPLPSFKRS